MGKKQGDKNENLQQFETALTTEGTRITLSSTIEDHHPTYKVSHCIRIMDEVETYNELRKFLNNK